MQVKTRDRAKVERPRCLLAVTPERAAKDCARSQRGALHLSLGGIAVDAGGGIAVVSSGCSSPTQVTNASVIGSPNF